MNNIKEYRLSVLFNMHWQNREHKNFVCLLNIGRKYDDYHHHHVFKYFKYWVSKLWGLNTAFPRGELQCSASLNLTAVVLSRVSIQLLTAVHGPLKWSPIWSERHKSLAPFQNSFHTLNYLRSPNPFKNIFIHIFPIPPTTFFPP